MWVSDITEHRTYENKLHFALMLDTFSRRVIGWSMESSQTAALVTDALEMAISNRQPAAGQPFIPIKECNSRPGPSLSVPEHQDHAINGRDRRLPR